jgi:hypothetical protein
VDREPGGLILAGALLAALLLVVAEFTTLYQVHVATSSLPIKSVSGGSNHSYAILVIGLAAGALGLGVWRSGSRPALLALGILGIVGLVVALAGDLPDSHAKGLAGSAARGYVNASSTPSAGLYMETLGAVLLIATCGLGFMMLGVPRPTRRRPPPSREGTGDAGDDRPGGAGGKRPGETAPGGAGEWSRRKRGGDPLR